jgi:hypothetical protein
MSKYFLTPMSATDTQLLVGSNFIKNFQKEMDEYLAPYRKNVKRGRPLSMGKELWEYAVADSIVGGEWCGAGKGIADVSIGTDIRCDVKSIQQSGKTTTEASMFQPLSENAIASKHFKDKNSNGLWNVYVDGWLKKVKSVKEYYLLFIIRDKVTLNCRLGAFKVTNNTATYNEDECKFLTASMQIETLADPELVEIKVYNSKTRLEIKVREKFFDDPKHCYQIYQFDQLGSNKQKDNE